METLFESIRIEEYGNAVVVYNSMLHARRIFKSAKELGFENAIVINDNETHTTEHNILFFQNQVTNYIQYQFNKVVAFQENIIAEPFKEAPTHQVHKLRFKYLENGAIEINHEKYDRNLKAEWKVRIIDPEEFHIHSEELAWKHKLYNRENIPVSVEWQEQIWLNEKEEVCEGTFTNIFWQDENGDWYTPSLKTNILPGIMRGLLIPRLQAKEVEYTIYDLKKASKIYLTNAMIGLKEIKIQNL